MSAYTKGPWKPVSEAGEIWPHDFGLQSPEGTYIATVKTHGCTPQEANARLLAAAPEMLEALKDLLEQAELNAADDYDSGLSFTKAKAAISRAEGRAT